MADTANTGVRGALIGQHAQWRSTVWGEYVAEFLGTFVLVAFGCGSVAMTVAALNQSGRGPNPFDAAGDWLIIAWGWGFAVAFGVWVAGGVSGAHINPAVTLAFAVSRGFPWKKVPGYWISQVVGGFLGGALVYGVYQAAIGSFEQANGIVRGTTSSIPTFSIFATFPAGYFDSWPGPFVDQIVGTAFLVMFIYAVVDNLNQPVRANLAPLVIGFAVVAIGMSFGANAGYAINPARDLGPRLWALVAGWGPIAVPGDYGNISNYMWIPIVGPLVGGVIGGIIYDLFIRDVLKARGKKPEPVEAHGRTVEETD